MKLEKKTFTSIANKFKVKNMIKDAKVKGIIKPHTEAFEKFPTKNETHKGNADYFLN